MSDKDLYSVEQVNEQWYIGRSKRLPGQIYFFNPATGESVWYLSEIVNKGRCIDVVDSHEHFPEPGYSPNHSSDTNNGLSSALSQDYKNVWDEPPAALFEQAVNKQKPNENFAASLSNHVNDQSNYFPSQTTINNNNSKTKILSNAPVNVNILKKYINQTKQLSNKIEPQVNTKTVLSNKSLNIRQSLNRFTIKDNNDSNTESNSNNLTTNQPLPANDENHNQQFLVKSKKEDETQSNLLSERFKIIQDKSVCKTVTASVLKRHVVNFDNEPVQKKAFLNTNDLRLKLMARRKPRELFGADLFNKHDGHEDINIQNKSMLRIIEHDNNTAGGSCTSKESYRSANPLNWDVSFMKKFSAAAVRTDIWYIVVDTNVLLYNLTFIDRLVKSDPTCHMMVPYQVHKELEFKTNSQIHKLASMAANAVRYITLQLKLNTSVMVQAAIKAIHRKITCRNSEDEIINCCLQVIDDNFYVVLLTNNVALASRAKSLDIVSFTLNQVKDYIINKSENNSSPEQCKIVIPNIINNSSWSIERHIAEFLPNSSNNRKALNANTASNTFVSQKFTQNINSQRVNLPEENIVLKECTANIRSTLRKLLPQKNAGCTGLDQNRKIRIDNKPECTTIQAQKHTEHSNIPVYNICRNTSIQLPKYIPSMRNKFVSNSNPSVIKFTSQTVIKDEMNNNELLNKFIGRNLPISIKRISSNINNPKRIIQNSNNNVGLGLQDTVKNDEQSKPSSWSLTNDFDDSSTTTEASLQIETNNTFDLDKENYFDSFIAHNRKKLVSCLTRVIKDYLSQILKLYPVKGDMLPAPWNFRETVFNIKSIFDLHPCIGPASKALNERILTNSNLLGVLNKNIHPKQYMLMYNEATELVKALKKEHPNNKNIEDTEITLLSIIKSIHNNDEENLNILYDDKCTKPAVIRESSEESGCYEIEQTTINNTSDAKKIELETVSSHIPKSVLNTYVRDNSINNVVEFIKTLFTDIKSTFTHMRHFYTECNANLNENVSESKKANLKQKACDQYHTASKILNLLECILQRDAGPEAVQGILADKKKYVSTQYRNAIAKYIQQAKVLLEDINTIRNKVM